MKLRVPKQVGEWMKRDRDDFKVEFYQGSGAGGQHRNRTASCCRITDMPTGISASGTKHRSQHQNQQDAFETLALRVRDYYLKLYKDLQQIVVERPVKVVRTYKYGSIVIDHRLKSEYDARDVLNGHLEKIHRELRERYG